MDQHDLKELFARELAGEPPAPAVDVGAEAIVEGTRLRRRRAVLSTGGAALGVAAVLGVAVAVATGVPTATRPAPVPAAAPSAARHRCLPPAELRSSGLTGIDVSVYLASRVTAARRADLAAALRADPAVRGVAYQDRESAYRQFRELWRDNPDLVAATAPGQLPESFRVELRDPSAFADFNARFAGRPGVGSIVDENRRDAPASCPGGAASGGR